MQAECSQGLQIGCVSGQQAGRVTVQHADEGGPWDARVVSTPCVPPGHQARPFTEPCGSSCAASVRTTGRRSDHTRCTCRVSPWRACASRDCHARRGRRRPCHSACTAQKGQTSISTSVKAACCIVCFPPCHSHPYLKGFGQNVKSNKHCTWKP